uniref:Large ribosomal subunit protein mL46 n=1 Tax=Clastoptera arizonana TaxID=38151 RepID=A0A1B6DCR1_9HEMI
MFKLLRLFKSLQNQMVFPNYTSKVLTECYQNNAFCIAANTSEKWDLLSAVSLERKPIITKNLNDMEQKFIKLLSEIEYERSHKSDHEVRKEKDKVKVQQLKSAKNTDFEGEVIQQTAQDLEDLYKDELKHFKFSDRKTEADYKNDLKSVNRVLDQSLLLLIKQKIGNKMYWTLPQGINLEGETMRQTAERVLKECCGGSLNAKFLGNAPCGFYKYKYPKKCSKDDSIIGAKIFFFKAQLISGVPEFSNQQKIEYQWATRSELNTMLQKDYKRSVSLFLVDNETE